MRFPLVTRRRFEEELREACAAEATAIKAKNRAETALRMAFGISTEDVYDKDVKQITVWVAKAVLKQFQGDPRKLMRDEMHRSLDKIIDNKPGVIG